MARKITGNERPPLPAPSQPALMKLAATLALLCVTTFASAQQAPKAKAKGGKLNQPKLTEQEVKHEEKLYKTTPQGELKLHISQPMDWKASDKRPVIVCFFGGGWSKGSYAQFVSLCDYLAARGMVGISADYRISSIHHTTPDKCVEDAKSAIRYVRSHAPELGIDPDRIVSSGGSAGGHLAACTALIEGLDADSDDKSISPRPQAMVLFNPVVNFDEFMPKPVDAEGKISAASITPNRFIKAGTPPAIFFFGTEDKLIAGAKEYQAKGQPLGLRAELWTAAGQGHSFFNRAPWIQLTAKKTDEFLSSLGYIKGEPAIKMPEGTAEQLVEMK